MNFNFTSHAVAFSRAACFSFPGLSTHNLSETSVLLGHTNHEDEVFFFLPYFLITDLFGIPSKIFSHGIGGWGTAVDWVVCDVPMADTGNCTIW